MENNFEITKDVRKFLDKYKKTHASVASVTEKDVDGEKQGNISDELLESLKKTRDLFVSEKYANERLENAKKIVLHKANEILDALRNSEKHTPSFRAAAAKIELDVSVIANDSYVGDDAAAIYISVRGIGDADDLVDDSDIEPSALHYKGDPGSEIESSAESWDWAAWLGVEESPFYDEDFVRGLMADRQSQALEQFAQCLDETEFDDDVERALISKIRGLEKELREVG